LPKTQDTFGCEANILSLNQATGDFNALKDTSCPGYGGHGKNNAPSLST
jgi:hypothetical protein